MAKKDSYSESLKKDFITLFEILELNERQKHYLKCRWLDQILWMEGRANHARQRYYQLRLTTIIGGVIVPILLSLNININNKPSFDSYLKGFTIALSGMVAISSSIEEFFNYGERWRHYRRTTEILKVQGWELFELSGSYAGYKTHEEAFSNFAGNVETIIQSNVEVYVTNISQESKKQEQEKTSKL
ncbi:MAG: DUF4231 domain-containing protein [Nodularia sp. (in: Bacteria)]|nr:MAG: DUF4231 domain-containing protein [Nodularia sp. (in: cyanobacteria)]